MGFRCTHRAFPAITAWLVPGGKDGVQPPWEARVRPPHPSRQLIGERMQFVGTADHFGTQGMWICKLWKGLAWKQRGSWSCHSAVIPSFWNSCGRVVLMFLLTACSRPGGAGRGPQTKEIALLLDKILVPGEVIYSTSPSPVAVTMPAGRCTSCLGEPGIVLSLHRRREKHKEEDRRRQALYTRGTDCVEQDLAFIVPQISTSSCPDAPFWKRGWSSGGTCEQ